MGIAASEGHRLERERIHSLIDASPSPPPPLPPPPPLLLERHGRRGASTARETERVGQ